MNHTILEVLQTEARMGPVDFTERLVSRQALLRLAVALLEKGYPLDTAIEPLLGQYGATELVPDCQEQPMESRVFDVRVTIKPCDCRLHDD